MGEVTIGLTTQTAVDIEAACGEVFDGPDSTSDTCNAATGERSWAYTELEDALDSWAPYI